MRSRRRERAGSKSEKRQKAEVVSEINSFDEVLEAALKLPEGQRELLSDLLLGSIERDFLLSEAWLAEIERRSREFDENPRRVFHGKK